MTSISSFRDVIDQFGGPADFARAVGMSAGAAKQARRRDSLGSDWFAATVRAAVAADKPITLDILAEIAERRRCEAA